MHTECPYCQLVMELADWQKGRLAQCPNCGRAFEVRPYVEESETEGDESRRRFRLSTQTSLIILGIWVVLTAGGALLYKMAMSSFERQKQEATRREAWTLKEKGDYHLEQRNYAEAREAYEQALAAVRQMEITDLMLERTLEGMMKTDEIKYLALGMVKFRDRWMSREEKEDLEMTERGLVKFEERWLPAQEVEKIKQERAQAAEAEKRATLDEVLKTEAGEKGIQVVEDFLRVANNLAPQEAADRYLRQVIPGSPQDIPPIVIDYAVDKEPVVASDDSAVEDVSRVYCQVKAYITISTPEGNKRLRWFFKVRKVGAEWLITSLKREG